MGTNVETNGGLEVEKAPILAAGDAVTGQTQTYNVGQIVSFVEHPETYGRKIRGFVLQTPQDARKLSEETGIAHAETFHIRPFTSREPTYIIPEAHVADISPFAIHQLGVTAVTRPPRPAEPDLLS